MSIMSPFRSVVAQFQILTHFRHLYTVTLTYGRTTGRLRKHLLTICFKHSDTGITGYISKSAIVYIYQRLITN